MIRRSNEMLEDIKVNMRGGEGQAIIKHVYKKDELKGNSRLCATITLEPGHSIGEHSHEGEEEIYYILQGVATVMDDGEPVEVGPGDAVMTRDGGTHSIRNTGSETCVFMAIINLY